MTPKGTARRRSGQNRLSAAMESDIVSTVVVMTVAAVALIATYEGVNKFIGGPMRAQEAGDINRSPEKNAACTTVSYGQGATGQTVVKTFNNYNSQSDETIRLEKVAGINPGELATAHTVHFCTIAVPPYDPAQPGHFVYDMYTASQAAGHKEVSPQQFEQIVNNQ